MKGEIFKAKVNSFLGILFVGSAALLATVIIWQAAFDESPLVNVFMKYTVVYHGALDN